MTLDKNSIKINLELSLAEVEVLVNALAQEPYIKVARLIQKLQDITASKLTELGANNQEAKPEG